MPAFSWPKRPKLPRQTLIAPKGGKPKGLWRGRVLPRLEELESRLNPASIINQGPSLFFLSSQIGAVTAGQAITPSVQVVVFDPSITTVTISAEPASPVNAGEDYNEATFAAAATPNLTAQLSSPFDAASTLSEPVVNSIATFDNLIPDTAGTYTLTAADAAYPDAPGHVSSPSAAFTVAASQLVFLTQPSSATSGAPVSPDLRVQLEDANNNPVTFSGDLITLTLNGPGGSQTVLNTVPTDANGVAVFGSLSIGTETATTYTLSASYGVGNSGSSDPFTVSPASTVDLASLQPPTIATAGAPFELSVSFMGQGQGSAAPSNANISWGDGALENDPVTVTGEQGSLTFSHTYTNQGVYSVTVLLTDADGNPVGGSPLQASVEVLPAGVGAVDEVQGIPGATVTRSVTDPVSGTVTTDSLTLAPGDPPPPPERTLIAAPLEGYVFQPPADVVQVIASFEIRGENLGTADSATVTFRFPGALPSGTIPQIIVDGKVFVGQSFVLQDGKTLTVIIVLDNNSVPRLADLTGTVFTVAAATPGPAAVAAVGPAVASTASGPVAAVQTSFQSTSQLTLTLAASQAGQASTSRSSLSVDGGGDEPISDADADALLHFLFENMNLLPKLTLPHNASDAIRMWLNQVSLTTPDGVPADAVVTAAERLAAFDSISGWLPSAAGTFIPAVASGGARGVAAPPRAEHRGPAKAGPALLGAVPLAGLGLDAATRKRRRKVAPPG